MIDSLSLNAPLDLRDTPDRVWVYVLDPSQPRAPYDIEIECVDWTGYGYAIDDCVLSCAAGVFHLFRGMYFSCPGPFKVRNGKAMIICKVGYRGLLNVGGPIEDIGRLRYIDGCTDTLLCSPVKRGDACLNHLHFPAGIEQTMHTHPSVRLGVVARGCGVCVMPNAKISLYPGMVWHLPAETPHCFFTSMATGSMDVVAWHPDSDFGPSDQDHPMINRTIIKGRSARELTDIHTK